MKQDCDDEIRQGLSALGVGVLEPSTPREERFAQALEAFSEFCLEQEPEQCLSLIQRHLSSTAGILQGGSDAHEIYRLVLEQQEDNQNSTTTLAAGNDLMRFFVTSAAGRRYASTLTVPKLQAYMLSMCDQFQLQGQHNGCSRQYTQLGNLMLILSFGPVPGQVRHIDDMDPNAQICLYMSKNCPSTVVYATTNDDGDDDEHDDDSDDDVRNSPLVGDEHHDGDSRMPLRILNQRDLVRFWETTRSGLPAFLRKILDTYGNVSLKSKKHTRYFGTTWPTINTMLRSFGKLYLPVQRRLALPATMPGTTLIATQNQVHAGPPTHLPRMFAFAIGIPSNNEDDNDHATTEDPMNRQQGRCECDEENDGEVQYNPVLFHLDLSCILFSLMDFEPDYMNGENGDQDAAQQSKSFLLRYLVDLIRDADGKFYGQTQPGIYDRLLGDDRQEVREWLCQLVQACMQGAEANVQRLVRQAVQDGQTMFYIPEIVHCRRKRRGKKSKKKA